MTGLLMVAAGGLGALARYGVEGAVQDRTGSARPWGTAVVNLLGALALGLLTGLDGRPSLPPGLAQVASTGFLGGFTTFSTWMVESLRMTEEGSTGGVVAGLVNIVGLLAGGVVGAAVGLLVGRYL